LQAEEVAAATAAAAAAATFEEKGGDPMATDPPPLPSRAASFSLRRGREEYIADVEASQRAIDAGETYEVCLTNMMHRKHQGRDGGKGDSQSEWSNSKGTTPHPTLYSTNSKFSTLL
jgi:anthranilate/para-aminobenzoate synthase component I